MLLVPVQDHKIPFRWSIGFLYGPARFISPEKPGGGVWWGFGAGTGLTSGSPADNLS